jgi:ABC-2 type transport system permease protein
VLIASGALVRNAPRSTARSIARARVLGDPAAFAIVFTVGLATLGAAMLIFAARFGEHAIAASGAAASVTGRAAAARPFRPATITHALRRKEWTLLRRDPWLMSQSLVQILYLLPPALYLWRSFGEGQGLSVVLVPLLVMAAGQLSGGLAWLAISGEDAPELVATAPVPRGWVVRAKIEAVLSAVAVVFAPLLLAFALLAPHEALVTAWFAGLAAASATAIQFWFKTQAKRSHFSRRHTSSRVATFAEAFSSIAWAATAALAASGTWIAVITGLLALGILGVTRLISPHGSARTA